MSSAAAGPLSWQPEVGLAADHASNPDLRNDDTRPESHVALILAAPIRYDGDTLRLSVNPSGRVSDTSGYASLASNYFRVDGTARWLAERGSISLSGGLARDSSLYHGGESDRGVGVRRDTRDAQLELQRTLGERTAARLSGSWSRVAYDQRAVFTNLTDYRYVSVAPGITYALTERDTVSLLGSAGRYDALNRLTSSKDYNLQLRLDRDLTERWQLTASAGYSQSRNRQKIFFGPFYLGESETRQKGSVYDLELKRRGENVSFEAGASRALRPSGFAFLSRQDSLHASLSYEYSERWSFTAGASLHRTLDPQRSGQAYRRRYFSGELAAFWRWTPEWQVSLRATRFGQRLDQSSYDANSTGVGLQLTRQFGRLDLER